MPHFSSIAHLCLAAVAATSLLTRQSLADEASRCGAAMQPWVSVAFGEGPWDDHFREEALQDLKAGLSNRGIEACAQSHGVETPPVASITISSAGKESVRVTVDVRDAITEKRVSRDVDLTGMPADGHALAIAVAADELVWASWAELAYNQTKRRSTAPPQVVVGVERALQPAPPAPTARPNSSRAQLGGQFAAERFGAALAQLGGDVVLVAPLTARLRLKLAAGARSGLVVQAPDGRITSTATTLALEGGVLLLSGASARLYWALGPRAAWVHFQGEAAPGSSGSSMAGLAVYAQTGPRAGLRLGATMWLEFGASLGLPLRAVRADDTGKMVTGASGLEQSATLSLQGDL